MFETKELIETPSQNHHKGGMQAVKQTVAKLQKSGNSYKLLNIDRLPKYKLIKLSELEPFDHNRVADCPWANRMLKQREYHLDMLAFGTLTVVESKAEKDEVTGYLVIDGNGRWLLATLYCIDNGIPLDSFEVPCAIMKMAEEEAADIFSYTQDAGRRKLSAEVLFVSAASGGSKQAKVIERVLLDIGCHVQGDACHAIPKKKRLDSVELKHRTVSDAYLKIANRDSDLLRLAKEVIHSAWSSNPSYSKKPTIDQSLFWALVSSLKTNEVLQSGQALIELKRYMKWAAEGFASQYKFGKSWKDNLSAYGGQTSVHHLLRYHFVEGFKNSNQITSGTKKRISNTEPPKK